VKGLTGVCNVASDTASQWRYTYSLS